MARKKLSNNEDQERIIDKGNDHRYFIIAQRVVWAIARNPYDYTLWCVLKDIAGDDRECTLSTPQLAILAMMSEGQVADSRKYLLDQNLIDGEKIVGTNNLVLWHISIPDLWEWNIRWAETYKSFNSRIQWKLEQKEDKKNGIEKVCRRCHNSFVTNGRRSKRCVNCQNEMNIEKENIYNHIKQPQKKFLEKLELSEQYCSLCEGTEDLELHLDSDSLKLTVVCEECHDHFHYGILRIHAMNPETEEFTDSYHESPPAPHESLPSPHESPPTWHESKKNVLEESLNINKKRDSYIIWKQVWKRTKGIFGVVTDLWEGNPYITVWEGDTLVVVVPNKDWHDWMVERQSFMTRFIEEVDPHFAISFKFMS
jgi:hypothetical protein